jgi:hypothetical protein
MIVSLDVSVSTVTALAFQPYTVFANTHWAPSVQLQVEPREVDLFCSAPRFPAFNGLCAVTQLHKKMTQLYANSTSLYPPSEPTQKDRVRTRPTPLSPSSSPPSGSFLLPRNVFQGQMSRPESSQSPQGNINLNLGRRRGQLRPIKTMLACATSTLDLSILFILQDTLYRQRNEGLTNVLSAQAFSISVSLWSMLSSFCSSLRTSFCIPWLDRTYMHLRSLPDNSNANLHANARVDSVPPLRPTHVTSPEFHFFPYTRIHLHLT